MERFELPDGWLWRSLADYVARLESGTRPRGGVSKYTHGVPSISAEQISVGGRFKWDRIKYVPEAFFEAARRGRIVQQDILVVKDGATTGKCAIVESGFPFDRAMVNEHTFVLQTKDGLLPKFAFYYLNSPYCEEYFIRSRQRGVIGGLTQQFPATLHIPVPPIADQRRIADRIDGLAERLRLSRCLHEEASVGASTVLSEAIEHEFLGVDCRVGRLQDLIIGKPRNGWSPPAQYEAGNGVPVLTLSAVTGYQYDGSKVKWTKAPTAEDAHYWVKPGELLITRSNTPALVGHAAIYDGNPPRCICSDLIMKMVIDRQKADIRFIHYWLQSATVRRFIVSHARGTSSTMKKINQGHVQQIPVPRISLDKQRSVVKHLNEIREKGERITTLLSEIDAELELFMPALLAKAFRGEL